MVRSSIQARARTSFVVWSRILILVPTSGANVNILFVGVESCAINGTGVAFILAKRKVGDLAFEVPHVCHGTTRKSQRG